MVYLGCHDSKYSEFNKDYGKLFISTKYASGIIKTEYYFNPLTHRGLIKEFNSTGNSKFIVETLDSSYNGLYEEFYGNGVISVRGNYLKGMKEGEFKTFSKNEKLLIVSNFHENKLFGDFMEFDSVEIIKSYKFFNPTGELMLNVKYSKKGVPVDFSGQFSGFDIINNNSLHSKDTFLDTVFVPDPPGYSVETYTSFTNYNDSLNIQYFKVLFKSGKAVYEKAIDSSGHYVFRRKVIVRDDQNEMVTQENNSINIYAGD